MESGCRTVVQRGRTIQHPRAGLLSRAEAALPAVTGIALSPSRALRLLPPLSCIHHHTRKLGRSTPALYQVSCITLTHLLRRVMLLMSDK